MLNFIIPGAQKSASTFIHKCLAEHPAIYMPADEISFFESPDYETSTVSSFWNLFNGNHNKILGIKRPSYLAKPEVPERIKKHAPDAKFIVVLRNPIRRAVSAYYHQMKYGFIPVKNIEQGLDDILNKKYVQDSKFARASEIIDFGFYCKQLERYFSFFDRKKFLILLHEDIVEKEYRQFKPFFHLCNAIPPIFRNRST